MKASTKPATPLPSDVLAYNAAQTGEAKAICELLVTGLSEALPTAECKVWHGSPVWFIDENPVAGYAVRKAYVQLLFWSGQSFDEPALKPEGKFKAAELALKEVAQISARDLKRWAKKARTIQWDYKNLVKRRGRLEKLGDW